MPIYIQVTYDDAQRQLPGPQPLAAKTLDLLDTLPRYYHQDRNVLAVLDVLGRELARVEAFMQAFMTGYFPQVADDSLGLLSVWEAILGLPIAPEGQSVADRQAAVLSAIRKRKSGTGADWVENVDTILGRGSWTYEENTPGAYQLTVLIPYDPESYRAQQARALLREITPAHMQIVTGLQQGFLVDISAVDEEPI